MKIFCAAVAIATTAASNDAPEKAGEIAIALTRDVVEIDAVFSGTDLTFFGAVTGIAPETPGLDIIAVIKGPPIAFDLRPIEKQNALWIAGDANRIENAPSLLMTAATRPINAIAPLPDQAAYELRSDRVQLPGADAIDETATTDFIETARREGFYRDEVGDIVFKKGALFTVSAELPADAVVGDYAVSVFLYQDGVLLARDAAQLSVEKVGIERQIYELAHGRPMIYGFFCVLISLLSGWLASLAFRK